MNSLYDFYEWIWHGSSGGARVLVICSFLILIHFIVTLVRRLGARVTAARAEPSLSKWKTVAGLAVSASVFSLYFAAFGLVLREFGVSLTAYFASASIVGLAVGFGSQGLVQDVVTGMTVVFSNLYDIGDLVEISGQTGIVRAVTMRFTVIENAFGAQVFIPNRTVTNVINYPRGYIRALADVTLSEAAELADAMESKVKTLMASIGEQFPGILITPPSIEGRMQTSSGKTYLRVKFRIWPGRGMPIETTFKQELVQALKTIEPTYADWMVTVNYEVETRVGALPNLLAKKMA